MACIIKCHFIHFLLAKYNIKREDKEKEEFKQINDLKTRVTTNATIKKYNDNSELLTKIKTEHFKMEKYIFPFKER